MLPVDALNGVTAPTTAGTQINGKTVSFDPKSGNYTSAGTSIAKTPTPTVATSGWGSKVLGKAPGL